MVIEGDELDSNEDIADDRVVARRIVALEPAARRLLATVAVSGGPTPLALIRELYAAQVPEAVDPDSWAEQLSGIGEVVEQLCQAGLLTRRGGEFDSTHDSAASQSSLSISGSGPVLEAAHGRIREVAIGELETGELAAIHLELGWALERFGGEPEALAEHFERGGELGRALEYAQAAATQASATLAFGRAVGLYRRALGLLDRLEQGGRTPDRGLRRKLRLALAEQLVNFGRGNLGQARYQLANGRATWDASSYNYTSVMLDRVAIFMLLGEGEIDKVCARIDELLAAVRRSSVALNPIIKRFVDQLIGRCWAVAAVASPGDTKLRKRVRKVCRRLRRTKFSLYIGEGTLYEAALSSLASDEADVRRRWREAELLFDQNGIECQLAAVRLRLAGVTEGGEAKTFSRAANKYFDRNGVSDPEMVVRMLVPSAG